MPLTLYCVESVAGSVPSLEHRAIELVANAPPLPTSRALAFESIGAGDTESTELSSLEPFSDATAAYEALGEPSSATIGGEDVTLLAQPDKCSPLLSISMSSTCVPHAAHV